MTSTFDLSTTVAARAFITSRTSAERHQLEEALRLYSDEGHAAALLEHVRTQLADLLPYVAGVIFEADSEEDNGRTLSSYGRVIYTDGRDSDEIDFGVLAWEPLNEMHGNVGPSAGYALIPATGDDDFDDYAENLDSWVRQMHARSQPVGV